MRAFLITAGIAVVLFMSGGAKGIGTQAEGIVSGCVIGGTEGISNCVQKASCPVPTITAVSPNTGPSAGGTPVAITGTNFIGATVLNFGPSNPASFTITNPTTLAVASSPSGSGTVDLTVTTPCGTSATSAADQFTYTSAPNPSQIFAANLALWFKADTGITLNGSTVSGWTDLSPSGCNLSQATAGLQPTFNAAGYNSKPAVVFVAASGTQLATTTNCLTALNSLSVGGFFAVGQMNSGTQAFGRLLTSCPNAITTCSDFTSTISALFITRNSSNNQFGFFDNSAIRAISAISLATNSRMGTVLGAGNTTAYLNNVAGTPVATTAVFNPGLTVVVGQVPNGAGAAWDGPICEIVAVNVTPTTLQLSQLDAYFVSHCGA